MPSQGPAGFWFRLIAFGWDYLVILAYLSPLVGVGALAYQFAPEISATLFSGPVRAQAVGFLLITLPVTLYFALSDSSAKRATWGKQRVGLAVVDTNGARLSVASSLLRTAVKFVPWEVAHFFIWQISFASDPESPVYAVGFMAVWVLLGVDLAAMSIGRRRRALHDRIAGAFVVRGFSDT